MSGILDGMQPADAQAMGRGWLPSGLQTFDEGEPLHLHCPPLLDDAVPWPAHAALRSGLSVTRASNGGVEQHPFAGH